jgi:hypothetical protein
MMPSPFCKIIVIASEEDYVLLLGLEKIYKAGNVFKIEAKEKDDWQGTITELVKSGVVNYENTCVLFAPCHNSVLGEFYFGGLKAGTVFDCMKYLCDGTKHSFQRVHFQSCYTGMILVTPTHFDSKRGDLLMVPKERNNIGVRKKLSDLQKEVRIWLYRMQKKNKSFTISGYVSTLLNSDALRNSDLLCSKCVGMPVSSKYANKCRRACFSYVSVRPNKVLQRALFNSSFQDSNKNPAKIKDITTKRKRNKEEKQLGPTPKRSSPRFL